MAAGAGELDNRMQEPAVPAGRGRKQASSLEQRLEAARALRPPRDAHCGCCFGRGRDAAIRAIEEVQG